VRRIAEEAGYLGSWDLGFAMTGAQGVISHGLVRDTMFDDNVPMYADERFEETTRATLEEIVARPNAVADRLVGRLLRALGARGTEAVRRLLD